MVPVPMGAAPSVTPLVGPVSSTVKVSLSSLRTSPSTSTLSVAVFWLAPKNRVPVVPAKSFPSVADPVSCVV